MTTTNRDSGTATSGRLEGRPACPPCLRTIDSYIRLEKIGKGAYGIVYRAIDKATGEIVAIKKGRMEKTSAREIQSLWSICHPAIVQLKEVVLGTSDDDRLAVYMVMEFVEKDLKSLLRSMPQALDGIRARKIMSQLLGGVRHLHGMGILHRDLKTANLLMTRGGDLKICDFGLCRLGVLGGRPGPYTPRVGTLWYQAPEILLGATEYSAAVDMWSVGCIMAELILRKKPMFPGCSEMDQMSRIIEVLGMPDEETLPELKQVIGAELFAFQYPYNSSLTPQRLQQRFPPGGSLGSDGLDLLTRLLEYNPKKRITADDALRHPWFRPEHRQRDSAPQQQEFSLFSCTPFLK